MSVIQLVMLTALAGDTVSISAGTLVNTNDKTATKLLDAKFARKLLKHEPTEEQLSKALDFVDDNGTTDPDEFDGEDSTDDTTGNPEGDDSPNPQRNRRRTRSKPDAS